MAFVYLQILKANRLILKSRAAEVRNLDNYPHVPATPSALGDCQQTSSPRPPSPGRVLKVLGEWVLPALPGEGSPPSPHWSSHPRSMCKRHMRINLTFTPRTSC